MDFAPCTIEWRFANFVWFIYIFVFLFVELDHDGQDVLDFAPPMIEWTY